MTNTASHAPYRRRGRSICQNIEDLLAIQEFDFDLTDPFFIAYFVGRTGVQLHERNDAIISAEDWTTECDAIIAAEEMPEKILRAQLQDCWWLYCEHREQEKIASDSLCAEHRIACALIAEWGVAAPDNIIQFPPQPRPTSHLKLPDGEPENIILVDFDDDADAITCSPNYSCPPL